MVQEAPWRIFFAIACDNETRRFCQKVIQSLKKRSGKMAVRWVSPQNLHITLRFIGNTQPSKVDTLFQCVTHTVAGCACFDAKTGPLAIFPSYQYPKVISFSPLPTANFVQLAQAIEQGIIAAGFPPETRPFRAHLTLGRIQKLPPSFSALDTVEQSFSVRDIVLLRSDNTPHGVRYTELHRIALGAAGNTT